MTDRSQTATTIQTATPYIGQLPFLSQGWNAAGQILNQGALVPDAYQAIMDRASPGNGNVNQANLAAAPQYLYGMLTRPQQPGLDALQGMMTDSGTNPYLDAMYGRAADQVKAGLQSEFAKAGRYGSGALADVTGRNLVDLANQMYGGQYNSDANRRLQAASLFSSGYTNDMTARLAAANTLPSASLAADFAYPEELAKVQQAEIDAPGNLVQRYMQMIGGPISGGGTTMAPYFSNPLSQAISALGGLANAASLGANAYAVLNKAGLFGSNGGVTSVNYIGPNGISSTPTDFFSQASLSDPLANYAIPT